MSRKVFRDGKWMDGKAAPEQLDEELRQLPGDYVTKEEADENRVHSLDPPHIRKAVAYDRLKAETTEVKKEPIKGLRRAPYGEVVPLRQDFIDVEKMYVMKGTVDGQIREVLEGQRLHPDLEVKQHLWFPENNVNNWVVKKGWAPPDSQRPKHLRGFDLNVDLMNIPQRVKDELRSQNKDAGYFLKRILQPKKSNSIIEVN